MKAQARGDAWLSNEDSDEYWAEGVKATIEVEVTDADEIRLGVVLENEESDAATIYLSRAEADRVSRFLAAASVTPAKVPAA